MKHSEITAAIRGMSLDEIIALFKELSELPTGHPFHGAMANLLVFFNEAVRERRNVI
jgi:hypothetical protein